jgi:hypothetical protein
MDPYWIAIIGLSAKTSLMAKKNIKHLIWAKTNPTKLKNLN